MSHVTVMQGVVIQDRAALTSAINELIQKHGLRGRIVENQKPRVHGYDSAPTCEIVLKLEGCNYDVGFQKQADGTYTPVFDVYGNHVGRAGLAATHACEVPAGFEGQALTQLGKLSQLYAMHAAMNQASAEGYVVDSCTVDAKTGEMRLLLNVG